MIILRQKQYNFRSFVDKISKSLIPGYKTEEERHAEWRAEDKRKREEEEKRTQEEIESKLPPEYKRLKALEPELSKIYPGVGDGDEYANYYLSPYYTGPGEIRVLYSPQSQYLDFSYNTELKCWIDNNQKGRRVTFPQIKKAILDFYIESEKDWIKNRHFDTDNYTDGSDEIIEYLGKAKKLIQTRL